MANNYFIIPTVNKEQFNIDDVYDILCREFSQFDISIENTFIKIEFRDYRIIARLFFTNECYLVDLKDDVKYLKYKNIELANKLSLLNECDFENVIQVSHTPFYRERNKIDKYLHSYFKCYIFDEGIHPEFIPPDYEFSEETGLVRKILNFFKKS